MAQINIFNKDKGYTLYHGTKEKPSDIIPLLHKANQITARPDYGYHRVDPDFVVLVLGGLEPYHMNMFEYRGESSAIYTYDLELRSAVPKDYWLLAVRDQERVLLEQTALAAIPDSLTQRDLRPENPQPDLIWKRHSDTSMEIYTLEHFPYTGWTCTCAGFRMGHKCKHIKEAERKFSP
jgi:hypothetical protein